MDLRQRGLLDKTRVLRADEFGRTVYCQGPLAQSNYGRDHHPRCLSIWLAEDSIKTGISYGKTDDYLYDAVENPVAVHDLHATMRWRMGLDQIKNTYRHQGRDYPLTGIHGEIVTDLLA